MISEAEPKGFVAGDTVQWLKRLPDYLPADGWILDYSFVTAAGLNSVVAIDNGDGRHLAEITATASALYSIGVHSWQSKVTKAPEVFTLGSGAVEVCPDFAVQSAGLDARSDWQMILDSLMVAYKDMTSGAITYAAVTYRGRSVTYRSQEELLTAISRARIEVGKEKQLAKIANGEDLGGKIFVRF